MNTHASNVRPVRSVDYPADLSRAWSGASSLGAMRHHHATISCTNVHPRTIAIVALAIAALWPTSLAAQRATTVHVRCAASPQAGTLAIAPSLVYSAERGYGFRAPLIGTSTSCESDRPFVLDVALPEGDYDVTVTLGAAERASNTTVRAERSPREVSATQVPFCRSRRVTSASASMGSLKCVA